MPAILLGPGELTGWDWGASLSPRFSNRHAQPQSLVCRQGSLSRKSGKAAQGGSVVWSGLVLVPGSQHIQLRFGAHLLISDCSLFICRITIISTLAGVRVEDQPVGDVSLLSTVLIAV